MEKESDVKEKRKTFDEFTRRERRIVQIVRRATGQRTIDEIRRFVHVLRVETREETKNIVRTHLQSTCRRTALRRDIVQRRSSTNRPPRDW